MRGQRAAVGLPSGPTSVLRRVRRAVLVRRRPLAVVLTAVAVVATLRTVAPPPPETVAVLTASADLPAGEVLTERDLATTQVPSDAVPDGVVAQATGRTLAAPLRRGEPVTDLRLVGPALARAYPGRLATPVRLPDAGMVALLRVGDRVDLVAADPQGGPARLVAAGLPVLALPGPDPAGSAGALPGRLVVLGVPDSEVDDVAQAAVTGFLTFAFSR